MLHWRRRSEANSTIKFADKIDSAAVTPMFLGVSIPYAGQVTLALTAA